MQEISEIGHVGPRVMGVPADINGQAHFRIVEKTGEKREKKRKIADGEKWKRKCFAN